MPTPEEERYGYDLSALDDLRQDLTEITGRQVLAEWIVRMLQTDGLWYSPEFGVDLRRRLSGVTSDRDRARVAARIEQTLARDDRVAAAKVTVAYDAPNERETVTLAVATADGVDPPFRMVLAIDAVNVKILSTQGL